jgi:hypothetical protein
VSRDDGEPRERAREPRQNFRAGDPDRAGFLFNEPERLATEEK